uniref:PUM-HD domain-containing protein n=1 Tax=Zooxanthella nutricula TaxID=1333877 RepID=A0A7S2PGW1_9DINO
MAFPTLALQQSIHNGSHKQWKHFLPCDFERSYRSKALSAAAPFRMAGNEAAIGADANRHVLGNVWSLACDAAGCRVVQAALEDGDDKMRRLIAKELEGRIWEALECPHANHVLQRCIILLRPSEMHFVFDELHARLRGPTVASQHKFGCRIVKRLLEGGSHDQVRRLVAALLPDFSTIAAHPYGTFVAQHLLYHAEEDQQAAILSEVSATLPELCKNSHGAAVVQVALSQGEPSQTMALCRSIIGVPGLLAHMGCCRHGCPAVIELVGALEGEHQDLQRARSEIVGHGAVLSDCRHGRKLLAALELAAPAAGAGSKAAPRGAAQTANIGGGEASNGGA